MKSIKLIFKVVNSKFLNLFGKIILATLAVYTIISLGIFVYCFVLFVNNL